MAKADLTAQRLRELLHYDPETGVFKWRVSRGPAKPGHVAGSPHNMGYWHIGIDRHHYLAHRLAWLYVTGEWPKHEIDHMDGNPANSKFTNLREATRSMNVQNLLRAQSNSTSGLLGVHKHGKYWAARIMANRVSTRLGLFKTPAEAHAAYIAAKRKLHPGGLL